jgi:glycerol kinase
LLALFRVPEAVLPEVVPSAHPVGTTEAFGGEVPVAALVGDQQAALFGSRCFSAGQAKNTYGTGCFLLQHTGSRAVASRNGLLTTRAASIGRGRQFALEGSVFTGGAAVQWLRDQLGIIAKAPDVDRLASQVPDSGGVVVVPAFTGFGAPHWDPDARGAIFGLTRGSDRRHFARAVLDSIAFQSADLVEAMERDSGQRILELRVDGGATKSKTLLQVQADLLQRPVVRPANIETTAMGAGMLAGLATDVWKLSDLKSAARGDVKVSPRMKASAAARRMEVWHHAVAAARVFKPNS